MIRASCSRCTSLPSLSQVTTDYSRYDAVPHQTTLHLVNNFVLQTTRFLNRFSAVCEEKLSDVSKNIQHLETQLSIIEAKLDSIEDAGADDVPPPAPEPAPAAPAPAAGGAPPPPPPAPDDEPPPPPPPIEDAPPEKKVKDDPRYNRFIKLLNMGVPLQAVKNKMGVEAPELVRTAQPGIYSCSHRS